MPIELELGPRMYALLWTLSVLKILHICLKAYAANEKDKPHDADHWNDQAEFRFRDRR